MGAEPGAPPASGVEAAPAHIAGATAAPAEEAEPVAAETGAGEPPDRMGAEPGAPPASPVEAAPAHIAGATADASAEEAEPVAAEIGARAPTEAGAHAAAATAAAEPRDAASVVDAEGEGGVAADTGAARGDGHAGAGAPETSMTRLAEIAAEDDDTAPARRDPPRALGIVLALVAAACLVAACFSHRWLANKHLGDFGYSPLSFQQCGVTCETISNFQVAEIASDSPFEENRVSMAFPVAGLLAFIVLLVASAGLVIAAGIAAANGRPNLPISPTTFALLGIMIGLISGCVFVATKPGGVGAVGVAWSFWAFGIGAVTGIAGAQLLARQIRPTDPDLLQDAMNPDQF
jgi:hypothetical protein